jgi:hypothetical protein
MTQHIKTPRSKWEFKGEKDPHGNQYQCERGDLVLGELTDDEMANAVFLHGDNALPIASRFSGEIKAPIVYLTAAKDRIRWLSRQNAKLEKEIQQLKDSAPQQDLVWMTREEFNHYTAIQKMKPVNLDFIREFALREMQRSKAAMNSSFYIGDEDDGHFFKVDALEWGLLARGLQREITKLGGL